MIRPPSSIPTKPWIDVHEYWCRRWRSLMAKHSGMSLCIGRIEFFLWQPSTALWKIWQETVPINTMQLFSRIISVANWPLVPYHSSINYPCARPTMPSCIRESNRSADVCRVAPILRAACLSWMEDIYYISKCVDMASACDIPRLVQCVPMYKKHFCAGFYVTSMDTAMALAQKVWKRATGNESAIFWHSFRGRYARNRLSRALLQKTRLSLSVHWLMTWKGLVFKWSRLQEMQAH